MINLFLTFVLSFKPVHMMQEPTTCGATKRFLREPITVTVKDRVLKVGNVKWRLEDSKVDGYYLATYKADPKAYMSMSILFDEFDGYLTIQGIDEKRKPCRDTVYFKRK